MRGLWGGITENWSRIGEDLSRTRFRSLLNSFADDNDPAYTVAKQPQSSTLASETVSAKKVLALASPRATPKSLFSAVDRKWHSKHSDSFVLYRIRGSSGLYL
jgi:hypothetical protein